MRAVYFRLGVLTAAMACVAPATSGFAASQDALFRVKISPKRDYNQIRSLAQAGDGKIWFTQNRSLGTIDRDGTVKHFRLGLRKGSSIPGALVRVGGLLYVSAGEAIFRTSRNGTLRRFDAPPTPPDGFGNILGPLNIGPDGALWMTFGQFHIARFDSASGTFRFFRAIADGQLFDPTNAGGSLWLHRGDSASELASAIRVSVTGERQMVIPLHERFPQYFRDSMSKPVTATVISMGRGLDGRPWIHFLAPDGDHVGAVNADGTITLRPDIVRLGALPPYQPGPSGTSWTRSRRANEPGTLLRVDRSGKQLRRLRVKVRPEPGFYGVQGYTFDRSGALWYGTYNGYIGRVERPLG